jgi:site-specific recombinase XerD
MKLSHVVARYIDCKRALGMRFDTEGSILGALCRALGDVEMTRVRAKPVLAFLNGTHPGLVTAYWTKKYSVLTGFYRFALTRGYAKLSPLPNNIPKLTAPAFSPHIYSRQELKRLLNAVPAACEGVNVAVEADVFRALLLLLYGAGLRLGEALSLKVADVDLDQAVLCVRESKFYKTRLVPIGMDLTFVLAQYVGGRSVGYFDQPDAPFLRLRSGNKVSHSVAQSAFRRVRNLAGVVRHDGSRHQPRLHDLRHTAAVHRLIAWYRSGENLQTLLPRLATYLGHVNLAAAQHYLTLTPELLHEASLRFERYALGTNLGDPS